MLKLKDYSFLLKKSCIFITLELLCSVQSPLVAFEYLKCDTSDLRFQRLKDDKKDINYLITNFYIDLYVEMIFWIYWIKQNTSLRSILPFYFLKYG